MLEFNTVDVDITGFSFLNPIARKVAEWIVDYFNSYIIKEIAEEYARSFLNQAMSDRQSLQRLLGYAITGMVETSVESSEPNGPADEDDIEINRSIDDHPVPPLRQRRKTSNSAYNRQNNQNGSYAPLDNLNYTTVLPPPQVPQPNNARLQEPRLQMNGSAGHRLPEGTLRNNFTAKRNEIIIRPKKLFSSKSSEKVEVNYIPMKPTML